MVVITTPAQLQAMNNNLTASYELANDIDMTGFNFTVIGDGTATTRRFKGIFDGKGFKIKNLTINKNTPNIGLFGYAENATVKNVGLVNSSINGTATTNYVGAVVGNALNTVVEQCYSTGSIIGQFGVGGIVGWLATGSTIRNCWSSCRTDGKGRVGGLTGNTNTTTSFIRDSYTFGLPFTSESVIPAQAITGSLGAGVAPTNVTRSYYNTDIFSYSEVGTGITTAQFKDASNFTGWDTNIWGFADYPYLKVFGIPSAPANIKTVTSISYLTPLTSSVRTHRSKVQVSVTFTHNLSQSLSKKAVAVVKSMIEDITSSVEVLENANIKTHIVSSHIEGIGSDANRSMRGTRNVGSAIQPISIVTDIFIPVDVEKPVYAVAYVMENQTTVSATHSKTNTYSQENRSEMQVI